MVTLEFLSPYPSMSQGHVLEVYCDESGSNGPDLLHLQQPIFSYAAAAVSDEEAFALLSRARRDHLIADPELKATSLTRTEAGRAALLQILSAVQGRYAFVTFDKVLGLSGKLFEYIYEPVFQDEPELLYEKNLHRFVAMYGYVFFTCGDELGSAALRQFQAFMRSGNPDDAPILFGAVPIDDRNPFSMVAKFARGYRDIIVADRARERRHGDWSLELAASGLWSLLNHFGVGGRPLRVTCDESPVLRQVAPHLTGDERDPGIWRARVLFGRDDISGWSLDRPIAFADSRDHPGLQLADLIAGTVTAVLGGRLPPDRFGPLAAELEPHWHEDSMMHDFQFVRPTERQALVNWLILEGLGDRAVRGEDPRFGLEALYHEAEVAFARGDFADITG